MIAPMRCVAAAILCLALPCAASAQVVEQGIGAQIRILDKLNGITTDTTIASREATIKGRIEVTLRECRYPAGNPAGDAYAFVTVREIGVDSPVFQGWMIASAPAINPMDHPRYDVWVLRCTTS